VTTVPWRRSPLALTVRAIAVAVDAKAGYVPGHSDGVSYLLGLMAREAGYSEEIAQRLELAAYLHDAGKLRVPDRILLARRRLTADEFAVIRRHPVWSANVARGLEDMEWSVPWIEHHHEHFDGSGYPDGLAGGNIPWPARMMLAADAFHVMTTDRPYQRSRTRREALAVLRENAGQQFCPSAVELLEARSHWQPRDDPLSGPPRRFTP
jgi:HD-GYP domain-containing protein (c-di-GMP phosphodiesterase class II)